MPSVQLARQLGKMALWVLADATLVYAKELRIAHCELLAPPHTKTNNSIIAVLLLGVVLEGHEQLPKKK